MATTRTGIGTRSATVGTSSVADTHGSPARFPAAWWAAGCLELRWAGCKQVPEVISGPASDVDLVRVWQVVSGTVVVTSGGRRLRAGAGAWLVLPGALVHQHIAAGTVLRSLGCRWRDAVGRLPLADMPPWEVPPRLHRDLDRAVIAIEGWIARHGAGWPDANAPRSVNRAPVDAVTYGRLQLALFTLLDVLLRDLSAAPVALAAADLSRAVAFLRSHGAGPYPGTAQVAAAAGLGVRTLEQRFVHDLGVTPAAWHRRLRVAEACRRLSGSDMSAAAAKPTVKAVARSLGFASAPIFRRWFHKACGCSPQAWQRRAHGP